MIKLEAREVSCAFGEHLAVDHVTVTIAPGELHAIVGENGAGKSTVLKMLAGAVVPSSGEVLIGGARLAPCTQAEAIRRGVGLVYQHFALVEALTALENLMLGVEPVGLLGVLRPREMAERAREVSARTGLAVPLEARVADLGVGERQRLEILRVMVRGAKALLLDEPTAVLTRSEAASLYELLRRLVREGVAVAVVTHHLADVPAHADRVTVMRRGRVVLCTPASETSVDELAEAALGMVPTAPSRPTLAVDAATVLAVEGITLTPLNDVSLSVRAGEIVGIAGIDGNGQDALVAALSGLVAPSRGRVLVGGTDVTHATVGARRALGVEVVHGDRHRFGLLAEATIADNLVLGDAATKDEAAVVARRLDASGAVPRDPTALAGSLSGGNQQKLVVARALDRRPRVLVAAYPTRGVDAAAAAALRERLVAIASDGAAVLVVSGDLVELREICHRVLVLASGRITAELPPDADETTMGRAMLGRHA